MKTSSVNNNPTSFSTTIVDLYKSSTDIEQCSDTEPYINDSMPHYDKSDFDIKIYDNFLMGMYYNKIKLSCNIKYFTVEEKDKYKYRPELLSTDEYDTPNLWYLILYLNDCEDVSEFTNMAYVLLPDMSVIEECIQNEEYIRSKKIK